MRRAVYAVIFVALAVVLVHQYRVRIQHQMVDFAVYRTAAVRVVHGEPLYRSSDGHYQLKYLPAFAIAMAPFGRIPVDASKIIWFGLSVAWLIWMLWASVTTLPERRMRADVLGLIVLVLMAKFYGHELTLGQANTLLGALIVTALVVLQMSRRNATTMAGLVIGLSVFAKPYAILLWPWLAFSRGVRAAAIAGAVIGAGLILPVAFYGWQGNLDQLAGWWHTVTASTAPNLLDTDNVSLAAMWAKWIGVGAAATALAGASTVATTGLVAAIVWRGRQLASSAYLDVAALMLIVPLVSPQGWDYVLLLGTPAVACLVDRWRELGVAWRVGVGLALATMSFTTFDVMGRAGYARFMDLSIVTVAALGLLAALAHVRWRRLA
jgi:hypothetical protein